MKTEIILKSQLLDVATALLDYGVPEVVPGVLAVCAAFAVDIAPRSPRYVVEIVAQLEEARHD